MADAASPMTTSSTKRPISPDLEALLGEKIPVLDDGFVRVVDYLGTDSAIVQAARVSYGAGTKKVSEDRGLIRYLMRHQHTTPFEMCEIKLHVRVPMDCWRQWIRHRTASVNEYSTRYSLAIDAAQQTAPDQWRQQSALNRQGSGENLADDLGKSLTDDESKLIEHARTVYQQRLDAGVAREQARKDLPLSTYTEAYWKVDLHNMLHFLALRMDEHAQWEIRQYANVLGEQVVSKWVPLAWEAFLDYRRSALKLSRLESELMGALLANDAGQAVQKAQELGWLDAEGKPSKRNRERTEFEAKLAQWNAKAPWLAD